MSVAEMFSEFVNNLAISNKETISDRYGELTRALNKKYRDTESTTANTLQVGSLGRSTAINGVSDLDMLYIMPRSRWEDYKECKQLKLLQDAKDAILARYPNTNVRVDRLVVTVTYTDFHVEVQPVFEQEDGSFKYPDTKNGGSWKITKPREEMEAIAASDAAKNSNLRRFCKMARAWKNKHGVCMGGLLIDTLAYNFLNSTSEYDTRSYHYYDWMVRDFFLYLSEQPDQDYYAALGSGQRVKVKKKFQSKAKKAYELTLEAIKSDGQKGVNDKWKKVFGRPFPVAKEDTTEASAANAVATWRNTEQFIEDQFPVDIRENLSIECKVTQDGFRPHFLRDMLRLRLPLRTRKTLHFWVQDISTPSPYTIYWKVLNRGEVAQRKDCIRGQIEEDPGKLEQIERADFRGDHVVECYCVKNNVVVAKDRIHVPIDPEGGQDE